MEFIVTAWAELALFADQLWVLFVNSGVGRVLGAVWPFLLCLAFASLDGILD